MLFEGGGVDNQLKPKNICSWWSSRYTYLDDRKHWPVLWTSSMLVAPSLWNYRPFLAYYVIFLQMFRTRFLVRGGIVPWGFPYECYLKITPRNMIVYRWGVRWPGWRIGRVFALTASHRLGSAAYEFTFLSFHLSDCLCGSLPIFRVASLSVCFSLKFIFDCSWV